MSDYWSSGHESHAEDLFYLKPGRKIYVDATYGSDGNAGNRKNPMKTLSGGYSQLRTGRNDTLFLGQGNYIQTAEVDWAKDDTNCIGLCDNVEGDYTQGGVNIYTVTATVVNTLDVIGDRCLFQNLKISNAGAAAICLSAVFLEGYGATFRNVNMMGILTAEQIASANPYSLGIGKGGYFPLFEDCIIGNNNYGPRTQTASGQLKFTATGVGTYPPDNGTFRRCKFNSWAETNTIAMVYLAAAGTAKLDRLWLFEQCVFYNFWTNSAAQMTQVFDDNEDHSHHILLKGCTAIGYAQWQTIDSALAWIQADMPITGVGGGLTSPPTAATGS